MGAKALKRGSLRISSDCAVHMVAMFPVSERAGKIDWTVCVCLGWLLFDFAKVRIISVSE